MPRSPKCYSAPDVLAEGTEPQAKFTRACPCGIDGFAHDGAANVLARGERIAVKTVVKGGPCGPQQSSVGEYVACVVAVDTTSRTLRCTDGGHYALVDSTAAPVMNTRSETFASTPSAVFLAIVALSCVVWYHKVFLNAVYAFGKGVRANPVTPSESGMGHTETRDGARPSPAPADPALRVTNLVPASAVAHLYPEVSNLMKNNPRDTFYVAAKPQDDCDVSSPKPEAPSEGQKRLSMSSAKPQAD